MQKIKTSTAKLLVFALVLALFAGFGPATLNAIAAEFLSNVVPSQVYLNVNLRQTVSENAYMGWIIETGDYYYGEATKLGDTYYISGAAAYNGSYKDENGSPYIGYFSSTDLARWTLLTGSLPSNVLSEGTSSNVQIPLYYRIVMTTGRTVTRGGESSLITKAGLLMSIPPAQMTEGSSVSYTVQSGDTLWGIVWNYYGTMQTRKVNEIYNANAEYFRGSGGVLRPGAIITLPPNGIRTPVTTTHLDQAVGLYRVRLNDTLADIAIRYYGSLAYVSKIYEANSDRIQRIGNSYMIYEQQWLIIPR